MPRSHVVAVSLAVATLAWWFGVHGVLLPAAQANLLAPSPTVSAVTVLGLAVLFAASIAAVAIAHVAEIAPPGIAKTLIVVGSIILGLIGGLFATTVAGVAAAAYLVGRVASWVHGRRTLNRLATETQAAEELT